MIRETALGTLRAHRKELEARGVKSVAVFGSVARDEETEASDIDILVDFRSTARIGLFEFIRLKDYLSELLGRRVDLATPEALHKKMKTQILQEAIYAD
jgi:uncharacterized protein